MSQDFLYSSFTLLLAGLYLLGTGILAKLALYLGYGRILLESGFIFFVAAVGLSLLLLSEHRRYKILKFIHRHFHKPTYDYRNVWTSFTQKTASLLDFRELCAAVTKTISETFLSSSVGIWLINENLNQTVLVASTGLSLSQESDRDFEKEISFLMERMRDQPEPVDLRRSDWDILSEAQKKVLEEARIRYCAPLVAGGNSSGS